ncbi:conserved Plasmodium protein, unknown function [Plasmodium gallinaceum]|uniref:Uncharacterized protein n=1 Tax=Plasmodium gallinaceum TaxID=5849 RepID=A0A1J1GUW6_PLAGA|nr:conserved Plasmodium protein, unknown function [Plasmodium gallinaceum]CRG95096.1 conserved Plasmodium protein, unknown function [Plasmodium gallinaceum]
MLFNYTKIIYKNVLIIFLYILFYESYYCGKEISNWNYRLIPFSINSKQKNFFYFIKSNSNELVNKKKFKSKLINIKEKKKRLFTTNITNLHDNNIPEEYIKNNIPPEPIYPYITVPDNLYTKEKNKDKKDEEKYPDLRKMTFEEFKKWNDNEIKKVKQLPDPTIVDFIEDIKYEKYIHPSLIKYVDKKNQRYMLYSLDKKINKTNQKATLNCFNENDLDNDLTEYDCAFKGIGPWPSTDELKKHDDIFEFDKTDLEMEYNITYCKSNYREYKEKNINKKISNIEKESLNKDNTYLDNVENDNSINSEGEFIDDIEDSEHDLSDNIKENLTDQNKNVSKSIPNKSSISEIRKLYYKKEVKTIKEAKEEIIKWDERKKHSRKKWNLTNEEINLLPKHYKELYFEKHKEYEKQKKDLWRKWHENSVGEQVLLDLSELHHSENDNNEKIDIEKNNTKEESDIETNFENDSEIKLQNFRLLENNVLYSKVKSPIENILYEWDDPLNCKWRKRAEEVIRDVIMYDYPFKELRRPSNLDLYDVTWYAGKLDIFVTTEEEKNYKISLFDLKQLVKKIAERLKELEIDEEIFILPFFELVVSSLPSKNILVCRRDWNNNIGKDVTVFFKDNIFQPVDGILLGSPSAFHLIINRYDEQIENFIINDIDKIILKDTKDNIGENFMLRAGINTKEKVGNEKDKDDNVDMNIKKELREIDEENKDSEFIKEDNKEIEDLEFNEINKLKNINKSLKDINDNEIKNINNIDDDNNDLVNSFIDDEEADDDDNDDEIDAYDNEFDDYMPDE